MTRVALIGCGSAKRPGSHPARDLYTGSLFRAALAHAEATAEHVFILSARYGLLALDRVVESYDQRLPAERGGGRSRWADGVALALFLAVEGQFALTVYAGADYAGAIWRAVHFSPRVVGRTVAQPLDGLTQGARLAWFAERRRERNAAPTAVRAVS